MALPKKHLWTKYGEQYSDTEFLLTEDSAKDDPPGWAIHYVFDFDTSTRRWASASTGTRAGTMSRSTTWCGCERTCGGPYARKRWPMRKWRAA